MADLIKTIEQVYPELNTNNKLKNISIKRFLVKYNEAFNVAIIVILLVTFVTLQEGSVSQQIIFRSINEAASISITIMSILNFVYLKHLYFESNYYGSPYVCIDLLSGPFCLLLDVIALIVGKNVLVLYYADAFRMLKFFTYEKLRIITKDIFYVMPRAKKVFYSMLFVFFIFSFVGFKLFSSVNADQFRNLFISMLSMFQVLTFDSWNLQMNLPIINEWGSHWSFFFIVAIFLLQFFYFNFFLSEFVTYYSNRSYRVNFVYKHSQDEKNNLKLKENHKRQINVSDMLKELNIQKDQREQNTVDLIFSYYKYAYIFIHLFIELLRVYFNPIALIYIVDILIGLLILAELYLELKEKRSLNGDESLLGIACQNSKVLILIIAGFVGFGADILAFAFGDFSLRYGSCFRILVLLTTVECQHTIPKLHAVFSNIGEMGLVNLIIIYSLAVIGYYGLYRFDKTFGFYFEDVTNAYLYLLQTITFDAWGDIARAAMLVNPLYGIYFAFMIIFMGFLLQNFMVGTIACTVQPDTEVEFNKSKVLARKMPKYFVNILKESLHSQQIKSKQKYEDDEQSKKNIKEFQTLIEEFNKGSQPMIVNLEGKSYNLKTKNIISLEN